MVDLEVAIQAVQQAIDSKPEDHPSRVMYLNNLVSKLGHRYDRTGNMADLEAAIQPYSRHQLHARRPPGLGGQIGQPWKQSQSPV